MRLFSLIILGITFLYLQIIWLPEIALMSIIPNIMISYYIFVCINLDYRKALTLAFVFSLITDLYYPQMLGIGMISSLLIVFLTEKYQKSIKKEKFLSVLLGVFFVNLIYFLSYYLLKFLFSVQDEYFLLKILIFFLYNTAITIVILYVLTFLSHLRLRLEI
ncbi:MAG: rod shape-determining protein MreD [Candidatus Cloacimonetes bacterium]|nr:rod shape-determining protein MreD [Candidatus Cloacimonadota bacterium]